MNCKQGDLAIVVRSTAGNEGKIVTCLRLLGADVAELSPDFRVVRGPVWETDTPLRGCFGTVDCCIADKQLRPLRDNPGEDEMLRIVGVPVTA